MLQNYSQPVISDFINRNYPVYKTSSIFNTANDSYSVITSRNVLEEIQENNQTETNITLRPSLSLNPKSYVPNLTPQSLFLSQLVSSKASLEQTISSMFQGIKEVEKIYISNNENLVLIKVILDMPTYDYDLMQKIFNEAEFPAKDSYPDKIIDFEYLPKGDVVALYDYKLILDREIFDITFNSVLNYRESFEVPNSIRYLW